MNLKAIHLLSDALAAEATSQAGNKYSFTDLQGLMEFEDGKREVFVYRMFPAKGVPAPSFKQGAYVPSIDLKVDFKTRKLVAELTGLRAVTAPRAAT